jgi:hypothetical protein
MARYVEQHELLWTPVLRSGWLGYQRPGGSYVPGIGLRPEKPVEFWVKIPDDPDQLGLENPYPHLRTAWDAADRHWGWEIPTLDDMPDVSKPIDISRRHQPATGPKARNV